MPSQEMLCSHPITTRTTNSFKNLRNLRLPHLADIIHLARPETPEKAQKQIKFSLFFGHEEAGAKVDCYSVTY
jgi:hypothetical protein